MRSCIKPLSGASGTAGSGHVKGRSYSFHLYGQNVTAITDVRAVSLQASTPARRGTDDTETREVRIYLDGSCYGDDHRIDHGAGGAEANGNDLQVSTCELVLKGWLRRPGHAIHKRRSVVPPPAAILKSEIDRWTPIINEAR